MEVKAETAEIDLGLVKKRAVSGVLTLTGRTFVLQIVSFLGFFLLTVFLNQAEIGLFFAVSELVAILGYFSDIGLAAALIQKKEKPEIKDIRSTFTIQQLLVISLLLLVFVATPWLRGFYNISRSGIWLLWALTVGFFLASLKTIPSVLLERKLRFDLLAAVEIIESLVFYGLAVVLAWKGWGITSYTVAVLTRGIIGVVLIYFLSPWPVGFAFEKESLKHLLKFGVPYQANTFLAVIKDRLMNVFLWKIVGAGGVGVLGWAQKWAQMPLRFIMDSVMKVTFPAYARMQENKKELTLAVEKTLFFVSLFIFPLLTGIGIMARPLIMMIPRYSKWEVALVALYFFIINSFFASITTPLTNALAAIGKITIVFKLMMMWTVLTWAIYPILAVRYGFNGVAFGAALVSASSLVAIWVAKENIKFKLLSSIIKPIIATIIMGIIVFTLSPLLVKNFLGLVSLIFIGGFIYLSLIFLITDESFKDDLKKIFHAIKVC